MDAAPDADDRGSPCNLCHRAFPPLPRLRPRRAGPRDWRDGDARHLPGERRATGVALLSPPAGRGRAHEGYSRGDQAVENSLEQGPRA